NNCALSSRASIKLRKCETRRPQRGVPGLRCQASRARRGPTAEVSARSERRDFLGGLEVVHAGRRGELHVAARGLDLDALDDARDLGGGLALDAVEHGLDLLRGGL